MDPDIKRIKFDISNTSFHDLIAYIYIRFAHDLIYFPFQGNRILDLESIKKAEKLNKKLKPYKIKLNYNNHFYIDEIRKFKDFSNSDVRDPYECLKELFKTHNYIGTISKIYDNNIYILANKYMNKTNYHPLSQHYALLAIAITLDNLSLNEQYMKNMKQKKGFKESKFIKDLIRKIFLINP